MFTASSGILNASGYSYSPFPMSIDTSLTLCQKEFAAQSELVSQPSRPHAFHYFL